MSGHDFFNAIPPFDDFRDVFDPARYRALPSGWLVAVCDIAGSTAAIGSGKYKEINIVGASAIIAVLNAVPGLAIPYVFGGDGASFAIPPDAAADVAAALLGTQAMADSAFGLSLRVGIVPAAAVRAAGHDIRVARYRLSEKVAIAMFDGGGLACAEKMIKDPQKKDDCNLKKWTKSPPFADFNGLQCRWNPLQAEHGHIVTLMACARGDDAAATYRALLEKIRAVCGAPENYRPAREEGLSLTFSPKKLRGEHGVQTYGRNLTGRALYALKLGFESLIGTVIFSRGIKMADIDGKNYLRALVLNTDFQKFDDTLRMVLDCTPAQMTELREYLEAHYEEGKIFYGLHVEQEALITCLVFSHADRHLHFVDGARGGYAAAARAMKQQVSSVPI